MEYARKINGQWQVEHGPWTSGPEVNAFRYDVRWLDSHPETVQALGLTRVTTGSTPEVPEGKVLTWKLEELGDQVLRTWTIQDPLASEARRIVWDRIKARRDEVLNNGADTLVGRVDCDVESRVNISGTIQMVTLALASGQELTTRWTMYDDTVMELTGEQMIQMGVQVGQWVAGAHQRSQELRALLDQQELDQAPAEAAWDLDILVGWPDDPPKKKTTTAKKKTTDQES
jgi:hypothetical protein